jgi:hypothetical protein
MQIKQFNFAVIMQWSGRLLATLWAMLLIISLLGSAISESFSHPTVETALLVLLGIMAVAGAVVSWWRDDLAGLLLVVSSAGLGIHIGFYVGHNHFFAWSFFGLPFLVSGCCLLFARWWNSRSS